MLIYSNVKNSTKNKPLTVCTCWNSYFWVDLWHGWLSFWGQNLCSWVNCISGIGADIRVLTQKQRIFFSPGFTCIYFLLNSTAGKGTQSAAKDYLLSMIKGNLSISYRNRHWQLPKEYLSVPLPLETTGCTREVQGWEKLQMEKRKDIWESSLNNQKTDWFQTKTGVI